MALLCISQVQAFMLGNTRVILPEGEAVPMVIISDGHEGALLIRPRVLANLTDQAAMSGVLVSPPLLRLEKGGRGLLRLQALALPSLPQDKESLMYLSVVGIPSSNPLSPAEGRVLPGMVIGAGIQVKVFYRPRSLNGLAAEPWKKLTVSRVPEGVKVDNPTPFHLTFSHINVDGKAVLIDAHHPTMLPPFGSIVYGTASMSKKVLNWTALNDMGGDENGSTVVK
ncbi:fimbrial biogenesis chaperone [Yersinia enterocolitica]